MQKDFKLAVAGAILVLSVGAGLTACQSAAAPAAPTSAAVATPSNSSTGAAAATPSGSSTGVAVATPGSSSASVNQASNRPGQATALRPTAGVVDTVGANQFTIKPNSGAASVTVNVANQTAIRKQIIATLADVKPGEGISVSGQASADGATIDAVAIQLTDATQFSRPAGGQFRGGQRQGTPTGNQLGRSGNQLGNQNGRQFSPRIFGTVDSVANGVIVLKRGATPSGQSASVKVTVSNTTSITKTTSGAFSDITPGADVLVMGQPGADGTIAASSVQLLPARAIQPTR